MKATFLLPVLAFAQLVRRDDATDGGGDPNANGGNSSSNNQFSNWVARPGQSPNLPTKDSLYTQSPSDLTKYKNGDVVDQRPISVAGTYAGVDTAFQVKLRTEDSHDAPALTIASVLLPRAGNTNGNVVVFQVPEDSVSINCAPTYQLFGRNAVPEIQSLIAEGYVVVVPDYEGQRGSYTVGKLSGKQVLDSARAAINLGPSLGNVTVKGNIGLWGYGSGAYAAGWAAEIAPSYAPELPIKALAVGSYITDLLDWLSNINGTPNAGDIVNSLLGMATEYKDVYDALQDVVLPRKRELFQSSGSRCASENQLWFFDQNVTSTYFSTDPFMQNDVKSVYQLNALGQAPPKASVFVYQGSKDVVASHNSVYNIMKTYCKAGTSVDYKEIENGSYSSTRNNYQDALSFLNAVLKGQAPNNSCAEISKF